MLTIYSNSKNKLNDKKNQIERKSPVLICYGHVGLVINPVHIGKTLIQEVYGALRKRNKNPHVKLNPVRKSKRMKIHRMNQSNLKL